MAEVVISSFAGEIVAFLDSQALEKVGKYCGVKHELKALRDIVSKLQPILDHAEEQYHKNYLIERWVEDLKHAFNEAYDVLEEFKIEALRRELRGDNEISKEVQTFFSGSNQFAFDLNMKSKVRGVWKKIEDIEANNKKFGLELCPADSRVQRQWTKREETHSHIREGDVKGRDDDKRAIKKFLLDSDVQENVSVLPIVGIGGLGKTALAQYVYNDKMVSEHFQLKMWVYVSQDFDKKRIVRTMIACAKKNGPNEILMEQLQIELRRVIDGKRYLLVLDDWWNEERETWLSLKSLLSGGARGSKILITTRLPLVIETIFLASPHPLKELSESASLELLMEMACCTEEELQDLDMLAIAKEIVRKCYGVPLAIRTIGNLLLGKQKLQWLHFKNNELPHVCQMEYNISSILKLSYDNLPPHLKRCFAFCSLFPKDYEINIQTLVNLWIVEGLISPSNSSQHLEDIAHEYFMDLLLLNFFQDFQKDPKTNKETCRMHDLMHDLACSVARTEHLVVGKFINERTYRTCVSSISNFIDGLPNSRSRASSLKTFLLAPKFGEMDQREQISEADLCQLIKSFKRLRILDLHVAIVQKVPRSICKLKFLTYLDLSDNKALKKLPNSITRLQNLQTLNLQGCFALVELPLDIRKLVSLRNLNIDYCHNLSHLPCGLGQLSLLHMLTRFILPNGQALAKNHCRLKELNALNNIRGRLCIENLGSIIDVEEESRVMDVEKESRDANLIAKESLESLALKWGSFDTNYAGIGNGDEMLLNGLRPHSNLKKLMINRYRAESFPWWMMEDLLNSLPNLVEVRFYFCGRCKHLPPLSLLRNLETLELWGLTELEKIESSGPSTSKSFPMLSKLEIHHCTKLQDMPLTPLLESLTLREVDRGLVNKIHDLTKLKSLHISQIKNLKCLPEKCLESLTSLESLTIGECEELDLSKDEKDNILDLPGLKNLQDLRIHGVPKLVSLPPWLLQASNLKQISIKECFNLEKLPGQMDALQSLEELEIIRCPSLTSLPEGRLVSLRHLKIIGCPKLEERCKKDTGVDWDKISHIQHITHKLKYYEHCL